MGLIENMSKKGRMGAKLPVPTTAGDDQVIAAKTGEYVLPPAVVAAIGVEKLNALVQSITGEAPGGEPAEMPEGPMHEMMEGEMQGHAKGGCVKGMKGYAGGGLISQFDGVRLNADPLQDDNQSLRKYRFNDGMGADSVATEVSRAAQGMPAADEVMQMGMDKMAQKQKPRPSLAQIREWEAMGALGEDSNIMGYNNGGLISRMMGYANGGPIDDLYGETQAKRAALRNFVPEAGRLQPQPANTYTRMGTEPNAARAPELRNFTPEPGRVPPGATTPRISSLAGQATQAPAPAAGMSAQDIANRVNRANPRPVTGAFPTAAPAAAPNAIDYDIPPEKRAAARSATMAEFEAAQRSAGTGQAAPSANAPTQPTPKPGLAERAGRVAGKTVGRIGSLAKTVTPFAMNEGVNRSFADMDTGYRDAFAQSVGAESPMGSVAADTARTMGNIGDAVTFGIAGRVGRGIASAAGGGSFGAGFASDSDRDRFLASKQPQQVAQAPQVAALPTIAAEPPAAAPQAIAAPAQAPTPAARGPVAGLAARAKTAPAQPSAPAVDPAVMADAQAAQAELDQSPIARVVGGTGGTMTIQYKDGTTKQVAGNQLDEVNAFYGLTSRASQQYAAQPVEVIAGNAGRAQALPEYGYQQFPDAIARSGKAGDYISGLAQGAMDRADPVAAEQRMQKFKTDEQMRAGNAEYARGVGERSLRNEGLRLDLDEKKQMAELKKRAIAGDPQAVQQWNMLRQKGGDDSQKERYGLIGKLSEAYAQNQPFDPNTKQPIPFEQWAEPMLRSATGAVKSTGPSYEQYAAQIRAKNPGANVTDAQLQAAYKKQFQQGQ